MFAELEVWYWQQNITEHEVKQKEGRKWACSLHFSVCSLLPIRQSHLSLPSSKLEIEVIPGLIKHAERCGDHKAFQLSLRKTEAVNLRSGTDRHLFISWKSTPLLNCEVSLGCCVAKSQPPCPYVFALYVRSTVIKKKVVTRAMGGRWIEKGCWQEAEFICAT